MRLRRRLRLIVQNERIIFGGVLKRDYYAKLVYIYQEPKIAWEYTRAREKIEYRAIDFEGFLDAYYRTLSNLQKFDTITSNKVSMDLVIKDEQNKIRQIYENFSMKDIDQYVKIEYNKDILRKSIHE